MALWQLWLIGAGIFLILEIATTGFFVFWFGIGCLFAMITSFFTDNILIQASVFLVSSTLLIFCTKPFVKKFVSSGKTKKTNAYALIDTIGIVTQTIQPLTGTGQVKIQGETWSAKADVTIEKGSFVIIKQIDGVKVVVEPTNEEVIKEKIV